MSNRLSCLNVSRHQIKCLCLLFFTLPLTLSLLAAVPDHSNVPGVVIDYSPASSKIYIGSPSIARLPGGDYIASHDFFGPGSQNNRTRIHCSRDKGLTWEILTDINGQWWSSLFVHRDTLYIMGTSRQNGFCVIRRSIDGGKTWTTPTNKNTGLLLSDSQYHCAPVPVVVHQGRIWRAMEERNPPEGWGSNFLAFVLSAPVNADLLKADSWTSTNRLRYNPEWPGSAWLEGNVVVTPAGKLVNILRNHTATGGKAAVIEIYDDGRQAHFNPETGFIDFPGGCKKFTIRFDSTSQRYWSLTNYIPEKHEGGNPERTRNTLALVASSDLINWTVRSVVLYHPDVEKTGFQYADWLFEGNDLITVVRTAFDDGLGGAHNCHDANYLTFQRIADFRQRTLSDPPLE